MTEFLDLKRVLRRNPLIYEVNARLKAKRAAWVLSKLERHYSRLAVERGVFYSPTSSLELLRKRLAERELGRGSVREGDLRIFWVGANFHQDASGLLAALQTFGRLVWFQNARGEYGLNYASDDGHIPIYDPTIVESNDRCLLAQVQDAFGREPPDLLIGQMWANFISARALRKVQKLGVVTVNISMDDRLPGHWGWHEGIRLGSVGLCAGLDLVLTTSPECCLRYMIEGCPALFWPPASDPNLFKPYPEDQKEYDVAFIGSNYGLRGKIIASLRRAGIQVEVFGPGWPKGSVDATHSAEIFGKSRIILGVGNVAYSENIYTLKLRDFDATMAGALYITHRNPDLLNLFEEGKEIECYASIDECVAKVRYYLGHLEQRMAIAAAAAAKARRDHTWQHRFVTLFDALGVLVVHP